MALSLGPRLLSGQTMRCENFMNFDDMPELRWRYGYATVLGVIAALDAYIFYRLRKARWL